MARLSDQQLVSVLRQAGFEGDALVTAFAVARAESGGDPRAHNPNASTGDNSFGLFQINMLGNLGPARRRQFGLDDNDDLFDPAVNARIAFEMSNGGQSWTPWSVHPDSKSRGGKGSGYEQHLDEARAAAGQVQTAGDDVTPAPAPVEAGGIAVPQVPDEIAGLPDDELRDYLKSTYGYMAWALDVPEVGDILLDVARGDVTDPDLLMGRLFATDWWQQTESAARQWDALVGQDSATAQAQVAGVLDGLKQYVSRLGLKVPDAALVDMSRDALRFGWVAPGQDPSSSSQLRNAVFAEAKRDNYTPEYLARGGDRAAILQGEPGIRARIQQMFTNRRLTPQEGQIDRLVQEVTSASRVDGSMEDQLSDIRGSLDLQSGFDLDAGTLSFTADEFRASATDYLLPLSEPEAERWAAQVARGETTQEAFQSYLQEQAASMFSGNPSIQNALERGMTVRQWADPYVQLAARTLEMNPQDVDLTDPRFMQGIHKVDPDSGEGTAMSLGDWQRYLRSQPEWQRTQNAFDEASRKVEFIASRMGVA